MVELRHQLLHARLQRRLLLLCVSQTLLKAGVVAILLRFRKSFLIAFAVALRLRIFAHLLLHPLQLLPLLILFAERHGVSVMFSRRQVGHAAQRRSQIVRQPALPRADRKCIRHRFPRRHR